MGVDRQLGSGSISKSFIEKEVFTFLDACRWVCDLPYRRNSTKEDALIVLKESCGTCSSKHELIKRLAEENEIGGCVLILCMFKMSGSNTPKVKAILEQFGLDYIPEAHTYVLIDDEVHDLTFPEHPELLYQKDILYTEAISADQIKSYKVETHQAYIAAWVVDNDLPFTFEEMWGLREACIELLSC